MMKYINDGKVWPDQRARAVLHEQQKRFKKDGFCRWVVEDFEKHQFLGFCGVGIFDPPGFLEIGWWIDEPFWGNGFATEAARCSLEHAFSVVGLEHLKSVSNAKNLASISVMKKIGLQLESKGTLDDYHRTPAETPIVTYSLNNPDLRD